MSEDRSVLFFFQDLRSLFIKLVRQQGNAFSKKIVNNSRLAALCDCLNLKYCLFFALQKAQKSK